MDPNGFLKTIFKSYYDLRLPGLSLVENLTFWDWFII